MTKKLVAEYIGTFTLAFGVALTLSGDVALETAVVAALILTAFVYTIGWLSGSHLNPGVTIGLYGVKKIKPVEAGWYITVQMLAGLTALFFIHGLERDVAPIQEADITALIFELFGMVLFTFGVAMVVAGKVKKSMSGIVIGISLLLGLTFSALGGGAALLNPAVSLALTTSVIGYYAVQVLGGFVGFRLAEYLVKDEKSK